MGNNSKKKRNWKARQVVKTKIDLSEQKKIKLDLDSIGQLDSKYDESNALVLPAKKRKTKVIRPHEKNAKLLSKKQRKRLEKIVEKKQKKENRSSLLESLAKTQVSQEELSLYTPFSQIQSKGLKRRFDGTDETFLKKLDLKELKGLGLDNVNSIKGRRRKRLMAVMFPAGKKDKSDDPNVVGLDESSEEDSDSDESEAEPEIGDTPEPEESPPESKEECQKEEVTTKEPSSFPETTTTEKTVIERKPAVFVTVERSKEVQENRLKLPILAEEQAIMEAISENQVVVLAGETGSGKTTQVPQFLYEGGYASSGRIIGITEPRRVAAISMARRVGEELNLSSDEVSYLIRFEGNVTPSTKIKFMTDGVLLKEVQKDFLLKSYSVIILDEAHERSVYTDILMGLLSRIVPLRHKLNDPLKLIIMSATLRVEDFTENKRLFKVPPPALKIESRQFPVSIHFNKKTATDYMREAYRKICRIHTQLPDGGILVFVTGQQEVKSLVMKLKKAFPLKSNRAFIKKIVTKESNEDEDDLNLKEAIQKVKRTKTLSLPTIELNSYDIAPNDDTEGDLLSDDDALDDGNELDDLAIPANAQPLWVLPLYSILPTYKQAKVFEPPPEGTRLCVVSTNVAETSLTIPGIKYVVDTGKVKTKLYDKRTGVSGFDVTWTSKAGANQRAGRSGRTGPGHCYRLYSSAVFNDNFDDWSVPEMQRRPVDDLLLQMKSLGIQKVVNFPFPTPPDREQLKTAERLLRLLGALEYPRNSKKEDDEFNCVLTPLGESMARFPVAPRFAKMLCLSHQHNLLEWTVALVAGMSVQELLLSTDEKKSRRAWAGTQGNSLLLGDAMVLLRAVGAAEYSNISGNLEEFCTQNHLRLKAVLESRKIRFQLTNEINLLNPDLNLTVNPKMDPPNETQARLLRQIMLSGLVDKVALRVEEVHSSSSSVQKQKPLYRTPELVDPVQIHSSSSLYKEKPPWIIFQEIFEAKEKMYIRGITAVEPEWLPVFAPSLCQMGEPMTDPPPRFDPDSGTVKCRLNGTFGRSAWELPFVEMEYPLGLDRIKWFAFFILDGVVYPKLAEYKKQLLSTPSTIVKSWAKLQSRTEFFLKTLLSKEVDSSGKLEKVWETDPTYLLSAYQKWLPDKLHNEAAVIWPPINKF